MPFNTNITSLVLPPQNICIPYWVYEQLKEFINKHRHLHEDIKSELRSHIGNFIGFSSPLSGWEGSSPFFGRVLLSFPSYQTKTVIKNIGRNIKQTMKSIPTREKTGKIIFVRVFKLTKNTLHRPSNDINGPIPRDGSHSAIIIISNSKQMTDAYSAIQETQVELGHIRRSSKPSSPVKPAKKEPYSFVPRFTKSREPVLDWSIGEPGNDPKICNTYPWIEPADISSVTPRDEHWHSKNIGLMIGAKGSNLKKIVQDLRQKYTNLQLRITIPERFSPFGPIWTITSSDVEAAKEVATRLNSLCKPPPPPSVTYYWTPRYPLNWKEDDADFDELEWCVSSDAENPTLIPTDTPVADDYDYHNAAQLVGRILGKGWKNYKAALQETFAEFPGIYLKGSPPSKDSSLKTPWKIQSSNPEAAMLFAKKLNWYFTEPESDEDKYASDSDD